MEQGRDRDFRDIYEIQDSARDIDLNSIFVEEYWSKQQSEETQKEYEEAKKLAEEAKIVADGENKYSIYSGFAVKGNLTGEQMSRFESEVKQNDVKHNYFFIWHTENGDVMIPGE